MYDELKHLSVQEQVEKLTRTLVGIPSINASEGGEVAVADAILDILRSYPYFQENPALVWEQTAINDALNRKNVFAFVKGGINAKQTIVYHAHIDTVGIEDFGALRPHAFDPDYLQSFFKGFEQDADVQADAQSGDWLFGRGSVDMQSGAAVHLANLLYFTEHRDELPGNLLVMFNPDEESQHAGVKSAVFELERLKNEWGLEYVAAINNDFITPQYDGDTTRYIYTGAAGKILPSFYIYGREAHVGDTLQGVDPNFIAAELTRRIHNNVELCENIPDEMVLPPTCLFQRDNKFTYNVQTATSSYLYFNYFLYRDSAADVMQKLRQITAEACQEITQYLSSQYEQYLHRSGLPRKHLTWDIEVVSLEEYSRDLKNRGIDVEAVCAKVTEEHKMLDVRMIAFKIVEVLNEMDPIKKPRVVLFFAPPYLPHNFLREDNLAEQAILTTMKQVLEQAQQESGETFEVKKFFPYLADGSYLSIHETNEELQSLLNNLPNVGNLYTLPVEEIRRLNIPSINMGVYGKDGHKWTERVYKPYSFGVLPGLIRETTISLLNNVPVKVN
ncbi:M20/M25/M40 family metallo-hydrolase [Pseudobacillus badius]|uniref:M20/M25/M40 family metallo-hydrolase n=1 Tax=Bacillus badius TaxID=1455 RepID=UPI0007B0887E|nr:M20/M25/M40 family metallo-hydrolase [Bacillus badius]KZO00840.1 peptidase M20 [Bacillus badius]OCS88772.1 peptidase M20 [Bacillus badius]OVE49577.1 peptidase M20 [Bacillus badius]TDW00953.1 arginine utilization protein RocB [Bacillus badius]